MSSTITKNSDLKEKNIEINNTKMQKKTKKKCMYVSAKKHKIGVMLYECLCSKKFCSLHRLSHQHECDFNYQEHSKVKLKENNPKVVAEKVITI